MAAWVRGLHEAEGVDYRGIAVFYRTNAMSRVVEEALIQAAVPYQIVKGVEFFHRREVKDVLAYLRLLINPADEVSLLRVINRPARGIGDTTVERLPAAAKAGGRTSGDRPERPVRRPRADVPRRPSGSAPSCRLIGDLGERLERPAAEIVRDGLSPQRAQAGLRRREGHRRGRERRGAHPLRRPVRRRQRRDRTAGGLAAYLQQTALISDIDSYDEKAGAVSLMTLHSAKGLEFDAVMIVGVEEGIIPHVRCAEDGRDLEEERRLLFVGITRAERFLALSHAQTRTGWSGPRQASLSPFLKGLPGLETVIAPFLTNGFSDGRGPEPASAPPEARPANNRPAAPGPEPAVVQAGPFRAGQRVRHPAIGSGTIEKVISDGPGARVIVCFENGARLTMDLSVARLESLD